MSGATFIDLSGAFQIQMGGREVAQISPGAAFQFRQRINLATNPSFEAVSASYATVRENLVPNPVPADTPGTWYGNYGTSGVGSSGYFSDAPLGQRFQATVTTQGSNTSNGIYYTGGATLRIRVTPGTTLNVVIDLAASTSRRRRIGMEWRDATGQALPSAPPAGYGPWVNPVPNAWQTYATSVFVPDDAATANLTLYTDQAVAGDTSGEVISVRRCIISTTPGPYFDGAYSPDPDLTPTWTGAANASPSQLRGVNVSGVDSSSSTTARITSTRWAASGTRAFRVFALTSSTDSFAHADVSTAPLLLPGRAYRVSATRHLMTPQAGTPHPRARSIMLVGYQGASSVANAAYQGGPNVAGSEVITTTWSVPSDSTTAANGATPGARIRLYNGASLGNGDVWWDDLIVEDVTDQVPADDSFFSGSSPSSEDVLHHWTGPADASTSAATQAWPPP